MSSAVTNSVSHPGLESLATAVVVLNDELTVRYFNPAAENLFALSAKNIVGHSLEKAFGDTNEIMAALDYASKHNCSYTQHELSLQAHDGAKIDLVAEPVEPP